MKTTKKTHGRAIQNGKQEQTHQHVSSVHDSQCRLLQRAIADQTRIGWHLAM
jgi:hypothetical protein